MFWQLINVLNVVLFLIFERKKEKTAVVIYSKDVTATHITDPYKIKFLATHIFLFDLNLFVNFG